MRRLASEAESEYVEPTPRARIRFAALLLCVLALGATLHAYLPGWLAQRATQPLCDQLPVVRGLAVVLLAMFLGPAALVGWQAVRVIRAGQLPVPGSLVVRRTKIRRGRPVVVGAHVALALAALVATAPIVLWQMVPAAWIEALRACSS